MLNLNRRAISVTVLCVLAFCGCDYPSQEPPSSQFEKAWEHSQTYRDREHIEVHTSIDRFTETGVIITDVLALNDSLIAAHFQYNVHSPEEPRANSVQLVTSLATVIEDSLMCGYGPPEYAQLIFLIDGERTRLDGEVSSRRADNELRFSGVFELDWSLIDSILSSEQAEGQVSTVRPPRCPKDSKKRFAYEFSLSTLDKDALRRMLSEIEKL